LNSKTAGITTVLRLSSQAEAETHNQQKQHQER
jgi:hypothetical protein